MKLKTLTAAAAMCGALAGASAAGASIVDLTFTGTVTSGYDGLDQFGGGDLTGDAFTTFYSFDTSMADVSSGSIKGGDDYGHPNALLSSTLTISGDSISVMGGIRTINQAFTNPGEDIFAQSANNDCSVFCYSLENQVTSPSSPGTVLSPLTLVGTGATQYLYYSNGTSNDSLDLTSTKVVITVDGVSAAPEPSTWALMILGVGMIGATLRRRPHAGSLAAA